MTRDEFLVIWAAWDDTPGEDVRAGRMCDASMALADELDISHMTLRRRLYAGRRAGWSYEASFDAAVSHDVV